MDRNPMNKRDYPLFMIDRSKAAAYPFDYITCLDRTVGFVARVVYFPADVQYYEFAKTIVKVENSEYFNVTFKMKKGGVILVCEDFLYFFELTNENKKRVQTLLKKALKKYLHTENDRLPGEDGYGIESQIKQQQLTIDRARQNLDNLIEQHGSENARYMVALAEATLETLKQFRDNQKFFYVGSN